MTDGAMLRLLDVVRRELNASDARIEIGGAEPSSDRSVWHKLSESRRIVVSFDEPLIVPDGVAERLRALVEAFSGTAATAQGARSRVPGALTSALLNEQLGLLAEHLAGARALVIDDASPVVWGSSDPFHRGRDGVTMAVRLAGLWSDAKQAGVDLALLLANASAGSAELLAHLPERTHDRLIRGMAELGSDEPRGERGWRGVLLAARAVADLRERGVAPGFSRTRVIVRDAGFGYVAKPFGSVYWLIVVFAEPFSELHAEAGLVRVLPRIERLVLALPPVDPPRGGARVLRLRPPR